MKLEKIQVQREEWALNIGGRLIPQSVLRDLTLPMFIILLGAFSYNLGQHDAQEYLKWISAFHGICDEANGQCQVCHTELKGNQVEWICIWKPMESESGLNLTGISQSLK